ncbi:hypothetical protein ACFLS1_07735 [Verrucomicrobiota bacterium]
MKKINRNRIIIGTGIAVLHFFITGAIMLVNFSMGMSRFDSGESISILEHVLDIICKILIFPIVTLFLHINAKVLPAPLGWIPFILNSLLWAGVILGVAIAAKNSKKQKPYCEKTEFRKGEGAMKKTLLMITFMMVANISVAEESVSVPWAEFKKLYRESIEREVMKKVKKTPEKKKSAVYTIDEAVYSLNVGEQNTKGKVLISGRIISGHPEYIPLFDKDIVMLNAGKVTGGSLASIQKDNERIVFLPDTTQNQFQIEISFLIQPQEDNRSRIVSFKTPRALRNSLKLELSPETHLVEGLGIPDADGIYHFSLSPSLAVRYLDKQGISAAAAAEIDIFSRVHFQGKRAIITTCFLPTQPIPPSFILNVQKDTQYVSSSLKSSWIKRQEDNSYRIEIPAEEKKMFSIQFAVKESGNGSFNLSLPGIKGNNGKEGNFVVAEPDDGQISLSGNGLISQIPIAGLGKQMGAIAGNNKFFMRISSLEPIKLDIKRFQSVSTPPIVLDSQCFFTSFEENGSVLSVLVMDIPPEVGPRMKVKSIPNTEIWSLTVNGKKRKVYSNDDNSWIIPLSGGENSHVELALLRQDEKLGLHGRLETVLPETGLPSRNVKVGIALPERVQLLSMEAPVNPAPEKIQKTPPEFIGKPYFFSRSFYKGGEMKIAISYKEPVKQKK